MTDHAYHAYHDAGRHASAKRAVKADPSAVICLPQMYSGTVVIVGARQDETGGILGVSLLPHYAEFFVRLSRTKRPYLVLSTRYALSGLETIGLVRRVSLDGRAVCYAITPRGKPVAEQVQRALTMIRLGG
jgi:hypothetical protein